MPYGDSYAECKWAKHPYIHGIEVSDNGRVISYRSGKLHELKPSDNGRGYYTVWVGYIHILVAETYIPNPYNLPEVNHKDGNKANNKVSNLEWSTMSDNKLHACRAGLRHDLEPVMVLETGEKFISHSECARAIGGTPSGIHDCKTGLHVSHRGYHFRFFSDDASDASERAYYYELKYGKPPRSTGLPIIAIDILTGEEAYFDNVGEASRMLNVPQPSISHVLRGDQRKTRNYAFEYAGREDRVLYGDDDNKLLSWIRIGIL